MKRRLMMTLMAAGLMLSAGAGLAQAQGGPPWQRGGFDRADRGRNMQDFRGGDFRGRGRGFDGPRRGAGQCPYDCPMCQRFSQRSQGRFDGPRGFDRQRGGRDSMNDRGGRGGWGMDRGPDRGRMFDGPYGRFDGRRDFRRPGPGKMGPGMGPGRFWDDDFDDDRPRAADRDDDRDKARPRDRQRDGDDRDDRPRRRFDDDRRPQREGPGPPPRPGDRERDREVE
jgi:hypothetical protein